MEKWDAVLYFKSLWLFIADKYSNTIEVVIFDGVEMHD